MVSRVTFSSPRWLGAIALATAACGGSVADTDGERLDATTGAEASATTDAGSDGDSSDAAFMCSTSPGVSLTDAAPSAYLGFSLIGAPGEIEGGVGDFTGMFYPSPIERPDQTCCQVIGPCVACTGSCDAGAPQPVSDGVLQIAGPRFPVLSVPFDSDAGGYFTESPMFEWGDTLCVSGAGDQAPSFPNLSVVVPDLFALTSPTIPEPPEGGVATVAIATGSDLVLTWAQTAPDVTVVSYLEYFSYPTLTCSFAGSSGTGTIPRAALASFGGHTPGAIFGVFAERRATYAVGTYALSVEATGGFEVYAIFE